MRYVMFVCGDPAGEKYVPEEDNAREWASEMDRRKVRILGHRLKGVEDATTVRRRQGKVLVTDGPFAETKVRIPRLPDRSFRRIVITDSAAS